MTPGRAAWLAWSLWTLAVMPIVLALVLLADESFGRGDTTGPVGLAFATVGALIASRRPANRIGWLFLVAGVAWAAAAPSAGYGRYGLFTHPGSLPAGELAVWLSGRLGDLAAGMTVLLLLIFPDGRLPSPRWRPAAWLMIGAFALVGLCQGFKPGPLSGGPVIKIENPLGIGGAAGAALEAVYGVGLVLAALAGFGSASALVVRLRRARGVERQQLKWIAYAASLAGTSMAAAIGLFVLGAWAPLTRAAWSAVGLAVALVPIAAGVAILRYRLYEIDRLINRTLVYGVLTAGLGAVYWVSVVVLGWLLRPLTQGQELAVIGSTLAVAALFHPARRWVQELVDRRFYRSRYDAARTLELFGARLRQETDLDALRVELLGVVDRTVRPAHSSLWLQPRAARDPLETRPGRRMSSRSP
jgi:hypothetical protein